MKLSEADQLAIRTVVELQLKAFQAGDGERAFSFASPGIQRQFGSVEQFMQMVKVSYASVCWPRSVVFEGITWMQSLPVQQIVLMDQNGRLFRAYYWMERQLDLSWRIAGCRLMPLDDDDTLG